MLDIQFSPLKKKKFPNISPALTPALAGYPDNSGLGGSQGQLLRTGTGSGKTESKSLKVLHFVQTLFWVEYYTSNG